MRTHFLFILLFCCFFWQAPVKHIETSSQVRVSGIADGGSTALYTVKMVALKPSEKITFTSFNVGNDSLKFQVYRRVDALSFSDKYEKGDTIFLSAHQFAPQRLPYVDKKEWGCSASICYQYKGKEKRICIEEIKKLPIEHLP